MFACFILPLSIPQLFLLFTFSFFYTSYCFQSIPHYSFLLFSCNISVKSFPPSSSLFWHVCIFHFIFLLITLFSFKRTFNSSACAVTPSSRSSCRSSDFCWKKIRGQTKSRLQFLLKMGKENKSWSTFKGLSVLNPEERKRIPLKFKRITFLPWKLNNGQEEENNLPDGLGFANKNCPFSFWIIITLHPCGSLWVV